MIDSDQPGAADKNAAMVWRERRRPCCWKTTRESTYRPGRSPASHCPDTAARCSCSLATSSCRSCQWKFCLTKKPIVITRGQCRSTAGAHWF